MKYLLTACAVFLITVFSCHQQDTAAISMQHTIDSLDSQLAHAYKPGLGEFMSGMQVHHAKLWFAAKNNNWPLAAFEIKEIKEALDDIRQYCTDRPEIKSLGMMEASVNCIDSAIQRASLVQFTNGYALLTATCNTCHRQTNHAFNVIVTPASPPFSNQDFKAPK